jgi:hypothetical protein
MGLNLNQLGLGDLFRLGREGRKPKVKPPAGRMTLPYRPRNARVYLKWLPAPMKNNMGIESMKFTREANNAVRPH